MAKPTNTQLRDELQQLKSRVVQLESQLPRRPHFVVSDESASASDSNGDETLREDEGNALYQDVPVGLCSFDRDLRYIDINQWFARHNGLERQRHLGYTIEELFPGRAASVIAKLRRVIDTGETITEESDLPIGYDPNVQRWFLHTYNPIMRAGQIVGATWTAVEISDRKAAESAIQESEKKFRAIFDRVPECVKILDGKGNLIDMNRAGLRMIEAEAIDAVRGESVYDLIVPEYLDEFVEKEHEVIAGADNSQVFEIIGLEGTRRWMETYQTPVFYPGMKEPWVLAVTRDISERQKIEQQRKENERWFRSVFEQAGLAVGVLDSRSGRIVRVNRKYEELVGYSSDELVQMTWMDLTHPDDLSPDSSRMEALIAGEIRDFSIEKRLIHRDGSVKWINLTVSPMWIEGDEVSQHIVIIEDLTETKQARDELRLSQEVIDNMAEGVSLTSADGTLVFTNPRFNEIFGYAAGELTGEPSQVLNAQDEETANEANDAILAELDEKRIWSGTSHNVNKSGSEFWTHSNVSSFDHPQFGPVHVAVVEDVTEAKLKDDLISAMVEGTAKATGADFFPAFATALASISKSRYVLVCEHIDSPVTRSRTLAFWAEGGLVDNIEFDLAGGPCAIPGRGEKAFFAKGVQERFPDHKELQTLQAESYCGVPLRDSEGNSIGHIAILDDQEMSANLCDQPALGVFFSRAAAEIERVNASRALRSREAQLQSLISAAPVVITAVSPHGNIELFDGQALESLGFQSGQFVGENYFELWDNCPWLTESMNACLAGGQPDPTLTEVRGHTLETRYSPVQNLDNSVSGAITVCVDVTDRVRAEKELRAQHNLLNSVMEGTLAAIFVKNLDGEYLMINTTTSKVTGLTSEQMIGKTDFDFFPEEIARELTKNDRYVVESAVAHRMEEIVTDARFDQPRTYLSTKAPYRDHDGRVIGIVGAAHDITEQKQAEAELRALQDDLAHVSRVSSMGEMATGLAHELNQPLAAISSYAYTGEQYLRTEVFDAAEFMDLFRKISSQALRAGEIIRRLRALVGKRDSQRVAADIEQPIGDVLQLLESSIKRNAIRVKRTGLARLTRVRIDEIQVQQVLVNIIQNALDVMEAVEPEERFLTITTRNVDDHAVELSICDNGPSVTSSDTLRAFEAFYTTKAEGIGMGLAISKTIIESHGGKLTMMPNIDRGVTVTITLPTLIVEQFNGDGEQQSRCDS